jgi:HSP20 family molecular chaperone IbpA
MAEVKVSKEQAVAKRETPVPTFFRPMFPFGRYFGSGPFGLMRELSEEMDRAFRGVIPSAQFEPWTPTVDVQQCNGDLVVTAELPGLKKEDVKVELTDDSLVIQGERKHEHKEDHEGFQSWERSYGQFYRSIPLPRLSQGRSKPSESYDLTFWLEPGAPQLNAQGTENKRNWPTTCKTRRQEPRRLL